MNRKERDSGGRSAAGIDVSRCWNISTYSVASGLQSRVTTMADWTRDYFERGYAQRWGLQSPSRSGPAGGRRSVELAPAVRAVPRHRYWLWPWAARARPCGTRSRGRWPRLLSGTPGSGATTLGGTSGSGSLDTWRYASAAFSIRMRGAAIVIDALGFFDTEEEHEAVLREAARVVTIGGRLALKVVNGGPVLDDFRETACEERDGVLVSVSNTGTRPASTDAED